MKPLMVITDALLDIPPKIQTREAVRAIIIHAGKILLMYSKKDQMVGTPGGGITFNESKLDALYRELLEETGANKVRILEYIGDTEEIRESRSLNKPIRILTGYYLVEVLEFANASLEEHEEEMGLEPKWMNIDEAIQMNEHIIGGLSQNKITFYYTQTEILKMMKNRFGL